MTTLQLLRLVEIIEAMYIGTSTKLLENLAKHFMITEPYESEFTYRQIKAAEYMAVSQESLTIISEGTKLAPDALAGIMQKIIDEDFNIQVPSGIKPSTQHLEEVLLELAQQAQSAYDVTNTTMLESTLQVYTAGVEAAYSVLNKTAVEVATGGSATMRASRAAVNAMADLGITGFVDSAGRNWTPEAYINMVTRTTVHNAQVQGRFAQMQDFDIHVFQVSSHEGARPLCAPYQGKFYSDNNTSGTVFDLDGNAYHYEPLSSTSYGEPAGLFGINCGHRPIPFFNHFSKAHFDPIETKAEQERNKKEYEETQIMRAQERDIRAVRSKAAMAKASGDTEQADFWNKKARQDYTEYRLWCEDHGHVPRPDRTYIGVRR